MTQTVHRQLLTCAASDNVCPVSGGLHGWHGGEVPSQGSIPDSSHRLVRRGGDAASAISVRSTSRCVDGPTDLPTGGRLDVPADGQRRGWSPERAVGVPTSRHIGDSHTDLRCRIRGASRWRAGDGPRGDQAVDGSDETREPALACCLGTETTKAVSAELHRVQASTVQTPTFSATNANGTGECKRRRSPSA